MSGEHPSHWGFPTWEQFERFTEVYERLKTWRWSEGNACLFAATLAGGVLLTVEEYEDRPV